MYCILHIQQSLINGLLDINQLSMLYNLLMLFVFPPSIAGMVPNIGQCHETGTSGGCMYVEITTCVESYCVKIAVHMRSD